MPGAARGWFALGIVEQDQRNFSAAAAAYEQTLENEPTMAEAAVNLGICQQEVGDLEAAKSAYRRAMRIRPDTFGRIAQALTMAPRGELWLDLRALRASLS
jgi:cytochrome c-type biogenesis protein CcmH/NrfG